MGLTPVNYDTWERKEFLEFFKQTTIYMTIQMDITTLYINLKQRGLRLYPVLVYCAAKVINSHPEFRYAYDSHGNTGTWDVIHPFYTVPRKSNRELFSMQCTTFSTNFSAFSFSVDQKTDFTPFVVFGKFIFDHERILLPGSGEFSHAVNDGVHISRFFDDLELLTSSVLNSDRS